MGVRRFNQLLRRNKSNAQVHNSHYNFSEMQTILGLCTRFLTTPLELPQFLRELARLTEADCAIALLVDPNRPLVICSSELSDAVSKAMAPALAILKEHIQHRAGVFFNSRRSTLTSVPPSPIHPNHAFVLFRKTGCFAAKSAQSLRVIHAAVHEKVIALQSARFAAATDLPPRVLDVNNGLLDGLSDKQIAARLGISPHTVHTHVKSLFKRQGVNSRAELLSAYLKQDGRLIGAASQQFPVPGDQFPRRQLQLYLKNIPANIPIPPILNALREEGFGLSQATRQRANSLAKLENSPLSLATSHAATIHSEQH